MAEVKKYQPGDVVNGWTFVKEYRSFNLWQRVAGGSVLKETFPKTQEPKSPKQQSSIDLTALL